MAQHALALGWTYREASVHTMRELRAMRWAAHEQEVQANRAKARRTGKTQVTRRG